MSVSPVESLAFSAVGAISVSLSLPLAANQHQNSGRSCIMCLSTQSSFRVLETRYHWYRYLETCRLWKIWRGGFGLTAVVPCRSSLCQASGLPVVLLMAAARLYQQGLQSSLSFVSLPLSALLAYRDGHELNSCHFMQSTPHGTTGAVPPPAQTRRQDGDYPCAALAQTGLGGTQQSVTSSEWGGGWGQGM